MDNSFNQKLIDLLKKDSRFIDEDGELVKSAVIDNAYKIDRQLVKLLLSDKHIKDKFFDEIEKHWIFNINTFIEFISDKNFLDNSYTRFRNKIGLTIDGKYLKERGKVCLVWPYKDCVLEGGQTKEEEKRKEIFFNEILAQDEIDRLLDPKVLTNFKRFTPEGEKKVAELKRDENGTIRENLIIKGNNLLALHCLKKQFAGMVKLIYIDPPYNTGGDSFGYNDNFNHSAWLTFMKNRLEVARTLLSKDGFIAIQIDDSEVAYAKIIMDEVLGREQFISQINWQRAPEGRTVLGQGSSFVINATEYILIYAKDIKQIPSVCPLLKEYEATEKALNQYNFFFKSEGSRKHLKTIKDERGNPIEIYQHENWEFDRIPSNIPIDQRIKNIEKLARIAAQQEESSLQQKILSAINPKFLHSIEYTPTLGRQKGNKVKLYYLDGGIILFLKNYAKVYGMSIFRCASMNNFWTNDDIQITGIAEEGNVELRRGKKPEKLLQRLIEMITIKNDIVLDYHLGSGTTAAVAHKMGRQYIGIEQLDYGDNDSVVRIKNVIGKKKKGLVEEYENYDMSGISKYAKWRGGGEFVYCELKKYNESYMDKIQATKTSKELTTLWKEIAENSFLNWYINPEMPGEAVKDFDEIGKTENGLDKQKKLLCELLNKNQLYVNLTEIGDKQFNISKDDKELNKAFYGQDY